jgi:hypothetical protein
MRKFGRRYSPDRKTIPLVHIRHDDDFADQAGQGSGIHGLFERLIVEDLENQLTGCKDTNGNPHILAKRYRDFPFIFVDLFYLR